MSCKVTLFPHDINVWTRFYDTCKLWKRKYKTNQDHWQLIDWLMKNRKNKETSVLFYSFNSSLHNCPIKLNFNQLHLTYSYYEIFPLEWSLINVYNWNYCTWGFMFMIIWWKRRSISFDPLAWKISSFLQLPSSPCHHPYQRF